MRIQFILLFGLAFAYATGAYYSNVTPTDAVATTETTTEARDRYLFRDGDIIFNTSVSPQSRAIQLATNSKYSHCGILFFENGKPFVYEAVQPVTKTPLDQWTQSHYVVKRLKDADKTLTPDVVKKMYAETKGFYGKNYDIYFNWSDDEIYCSELVYKVYERAAGIRVGELKKLKDYNLSHELVQQQLKQRYGNDIPYEEAMISPGAIFDSKLLVTVQAN